ncbi:MAG: hypothetical protein ACXABD_11965 [Candidatus Thorarchaeota archaeon]|jgi:hypothetical protein
MMEIYFDRPRGPTQNGAITWRPRREGEEFMWVHTHDDEGDARTGGKTLFLLRDPVACIFSLLSIAGFSISDDTVETECKAFLSLVTKWIVGGHVDDIILYEDCVANPARVLAEISQHHRVDFNEDRAILAIQTCTKEAVVKQASRQAEHMSKYHGPDLLHKSYPEHRKKFRSEYTQIIRHHVLNPDTSPWLSKYFQ